MGNILTSLLMKIRYKLIKIPIIFYIKKRWEVSKNSLFISSDWIKNVKDYFSTDHNQNEKLNTL